MSTALPVIRAAGCRTCMFRKPCGGLQLQQSLFGCFTDCGTGCGGAKCDWVCPNRPDFVDRIREVRGLEMCRAGKILPLRDVDLPAYAPMVRHGGSRVGVISTDTVALALEDVLKLKGTSYRPVEPDGIALRARFRIRPDAKVILVAVARDSVIERYWRLRRKHNVPSALRELGVLAVTIPNFSFFRDGPRTQALYNRRRMECVAEELSAVGVAVIPHLNATHAEDWDYWLGFLSEHKHVTQIAKEFQTGLRQPMLGREAIRQLSQLQDRLGRPLHPIVVGGARFAGQVGRGFEHATFVDSDPFLKTMKRRSRQVGGRWVHAPSTGPVDDLLEANVQKHAAYCARQFAAGQIEVLSTSLSGNRAGPQWIGRDHSRNALTPLTQQLEIR